MSNLYNTIEALCKKKQVNISVMCREAGVNRASLSDLKFGRAEKLSSSNLVKIAKYFGVSVEYLLGQETSEDIFSKYGLSPITKKKIPLLGEIACGQPIFANEDRESYVMSGTNLEADFCLTAKGDSMINARINDGDVIFIRKQNAVENGEIAAVIIDDEATLKRVYYYPEQNRLVLAAENTAYAPLVFVGEELDHIYILGKAIAFQSDVK